MYTTNNPTFLIVDDEPGARLIMRRFLESRGLTAFECSDGLDALSAIENFSGELVVFLDALMPGLSGLDTLKKIRELSRAEIKVIMVTALNESEDIATAISAGADEYIMKPIDKEAVFSKLSLLGVDV